MGTKYEFVIAFLPAFIVFIGWQVTVDIRNALKESREIEYRKIRAWFASFGAEEPDERVGK